MQILVLHFQLVQELQTNCLKTTKSKKKNYSKIVMLARSKLNSIESKILKNNEISHEDIVTTINEEEKYRELKGNIKIMNS